MTKAEAIREVLNTIEAAESKRDVHKEAVDYNLEWRDWEGFIKGLQAALMYMERIKK